ncbi:FAD-binding domain-containing protein [Hypoxylon sp. FL1284]|nr:FAD-binding domain-containing protein [Hypoxylon sp. FL1284]
MARHLSTLLGDLQSQVGPSLEVLTQKEDNRFQEFAKRWTDIGREIPAAIVLPESEEQIQETVRWALRSSVPFVTRSGGHSEWSTIGDDGVIIDLSKFKGVDVNVSNKKATLRGSILSKQVAVALADAGFFTGGGSSITNSVTGYGSDQILSARMVDAKGDLIEVTEETEPELLWAIRGAGQFFGLVTELCVRMHPLSALGNDQGAIWTGSFVFPLERAADVAQAMKLLMDDDKYVTSGLMMTMAPPPARKPSLVISARFVGNLDDAEAAYKPLYDINPIVTSGGPTPIQNTSDAREALGAKGGFKKFGVVGLKRFDIDRFLEVVEVWKTLVRECPDAINTAFNFQWDSRPPKQPNFESAMSLHDTRYWQNNLIWHTDPATQQRVDELNDKSIEIMRGPDRAEYADFQNGTRTGPIELRFRGEGKVEKLKMLKRKWDPQGVFTTQLLD